MLVDDLDVVTVTPQVVRGCDANQAGAEYNPAIVAAHMYAVASAFSKFYHDEPILNCDEPDRAATRLALSEAVLVVLKNGLELLCIPFLEAM